MKTISSKNLFTVLHEFEHFSDRESKEGGATTIKGFAKFVMFAQYSEFLSET